MKSGLLALGFASVAFVAQDAVGPQPRRLPWVSPDSTGAQVENATVLVNKWGYNIPEALPRTLSDHMIGGQSNAVVSTHYSGAGGPVRWSDTRIHGMPEDLSGQVKVKWGIMAHDVADWELDSCTFDTIPIEHGAYLKTIGGFRFIGCAFEDIGGQAIQSVYASPGSKREHESGYAGNPQGWWREFNARRWEWQEAIGCSVVNVGRPQDSERASFGLSFFELGAQQANPVRVRGCYMQTSSPWTDVNGIERDCAGAIMIHGRLRAELVGNYVEFLKGDRDVVQIWGVGDGRRGTVDVMIRNNQIQASKPVDIRLHSDSDTVVIGRNRGTAHVVISTNPWYVWESNGWDESKVIYRGPISQDYRLN